MNKEFFANIRKNKVARLGVIFVIAAFVIVDRQTSREVDHILAKHRENLRQNDVYGFAFLFARDSLTCAERKQLVNELLQDVQKESHLYQYLPRMYQWSFDRQYRSRILDMLNDSSRSGQVW